MTKYIQGKDGKFAGSIGDGKTNVPTPSNLPAPVAASPAQPDSSVSDAYAKFAAKKNPYKLDAWAAAPEFRWFKPEKATDWDDGWVIAKLTEYDRGPVAGSSIEQDWATDYIDGVLRIDPIAGSAWDENNRKHQYLAIQGITDVASDGHIMAVWHSENPDGSDPQNVLGFLTPNGKFYSNEEDPDETLRMSLSWSSEISENAGASLEEVQWHLAESESGWPVALEVRAESEGYRPRFDDPNDEYEPDRFL